MKSEYEYVYKVVPNISEVSHKSSKGQLKFFFQHNLPSILNKNDRDQDIYFPSVALSFITAQLWNQRSTNCWSLKLGQTDW